MGLTTYKNKFYLLLTNVSIKSCIKIINRFTCLAEPKLAKQEVSPTLPQAK